MKGPWWRWWRFNRRRRSTQHTVKPWNALVLVAGLVTLDQLTKHLLVPASWHDTSARWLIFSAAGLLIATALILIGVTRPMGILLLAGVIGNGISELLYSGVANPLSAQTERYQLTFNVADVYLYLTVILAIYVAATLRPRRQAP